MTEGFVKVKDGYKYQLQDATIFSTGILNRDISTDFIVLNRQGRLLLSKGYATDGITGISKYPWRKVLERDWLLYASFGHDALYQLMREGLLPKELKPLMDDLLVKWSLEAGAWKWQTDIVHGLVSMFGSNHADKKRDIIVVPAIA
jgi:hypothetical protein